MQTLLSFPDIGYLLVNKIFYYNLPIMKKISIVLPTFNEKDNLEKTVTEVLAQEKNLSDVKIEVVISDSGSSDGTLEVARKLVRENSHVHLINVDRGLGVGLIKGHLYALDHIKPDILVQLDADGQVEADIIPRLVKVIEDGFDLALGSRFAKGGKNELAFSRRLFTAGSSLVCRIIMGPWDILEFTNSARAFTPKLFKKINLDRLPWKEKTFINQPAFLHEAILTGAKYKEVPLVFKNRAAGYSKNKTINYIYDILTYAIDARLHLWGINIPFFNLSRKARTFYKFAIVGVTGTIIDLSVYNGLIILAHFPLASARIISAGLAIVNNFTFNNIWTFRDRKTKNSLFKKSGAYFLISLGAIGISAGITKVLDILYGDGILNLAGIRIAYHNIYFLLTIPVVMIWNFTLNHFITWRHHDQS